MARVEHGESGSLLTRLLLGEPEARRNAAAPLGFSADEPVRAIRVRSRADARGIQAELRKAAGRERIATAIYQGDIVGLCTGIPRLARRAVTIGVGERTPPRLSAESFCSASRTVDVMWPLRRWGTFELADVPLLAAVAHDDDVGEVLERRYLAPTAGLGRLRTLTEDTLRGYLANSLNVNATAAALGLHPNTVRYRLRQFTYATGVELADLENLFGIWWALKRSERRAALTAVR